MIDFGYGISLRSPSKKYLNYMFELRNNPFYRKWFRQYSILNFENHVEWYIKMRVDPTIEMFIVSSYPGGIAGMCGLTSIDRVNSRAEISMCVEDDSLKNGVLKTIIDHAFLNHNLNSNNLNLRDLNLRLSRCSSH
jgi:RimJ/RimL family protein N-acetyltransferase